MSTSIFEIRVENDAYDASQLIGDWNQDQDARKLAIARPPDTSGGETFDPKLIELAASLIVSVTSSVTSAMVVAKLQELAARRKLKIQVEAQPGAGDKAEISIVPKP